jgi:hypothetical protein
MKNIFKFFWIAALVAVIGFFIAGCDLIDNDYELLNGDWDTGEYVVTFNDSTGVFKELYAGFWLDAKNAGKINIGDECYKNIIKLGDKKWTCAIRIYDTNSYEALKWEECTITLSADGQSIQITSDTGTFTCTKK